jgi:hypothetical protein
MRKGIQVVRKGIQFLTKGIQIVTKGIQILTNGIRFLRKGIRLKKKGVPSVGTAISAGVHRGRPIRFSKPYRSHSFSCGTITFYRALLYVQ